ncbi:MAG TPA: hypothetical protein VF721_10075 [Pyrinomonadaceae bacterium]|jgi:hypothetical protein
MLGQDITVKLSLADSTMANSATVSSAQDSVDNLAAYADSSASLFSSITLLKTFAELSVSTGGYVQILPEHHYLPALIGNDSRPVFLYEIVELIDEYIDYDRIQEECPTLSFSQIAGAISFIRKVAQLNGANVDIDEMENAIDAQDPELLEALRNALVDVEAARVFPDTE